MGSIAPTYKAGYGGTISVDGTPHQVQGWKATDSVDTWDASATGDGGWGKKERAQRNIQFTFTMACKTGGAPGFQTGNIYLASFTLDGTTEYAGEILISSRNPNVDLKGGVMFDVTADSHGPMTTP